VLRAIVRPAAATRDHKCVDAVELAPAAYGLGKRALARGDLKLPNRSMAGRYRAKEAT
jgi:hypothetical protein